MASRLWMAAFMVDRGRPPCWNARMREAAKFWLGAMDWMSGEIARLAADWPPELPPQSSATGEAFWMEASRREMSTRDTLSAKLRRLIADGERSAMTALECWMLRRRVEWAAQLAMAKTAEGILPDAPLTEVLDWLLVSSWESDGCLAMWKHAERGGAPHPAGPFPGPG